MGFFEHHPELFSTASIEAYQRADDQVTASREFIDGVYESCYLDQVHPWDMSNEVRLSLVFAGSAFAHDRTAEQLLEAGAVTDKHGVSRATADIVTFGTELSKKAAEHMKYAQRTDGYFADQDLESQETRERLYPEVQLPYWPFLPGTENEYLWQHPGAHHVTPAFIKGITSAARDIEAEASSLLERFSAFDGPKPDYTEEAVSYIKRTILSNTAADLQAAEVMAMGLTDETPTSVLESVYSDVHDGYLRACWALSVVIAPQLIPEDD